MHFSISLYDIVVHVCTVDLHSATVSVITDNRCLSGLQNPTTVHLYLTKTRLIFAKFTLIHCIVESVDSISREARTRPYIIYYTTLKTSDSDKLLCFLNCVDMILADFLSNKPNKVYRNTCSRTSLSQYVKKSPKN